MPDPVKKKIKDNPSGETKWTTKAGTYITTVRVGSNLLSLPPIACSNTTSKWTTMPREHPMMISLGAT
jgi:hypothetical protein